MFIKNGLLRQHLLTGWCDMAAGIQIYNERGSILIDDTMFNQKVNNEYVVGNLPHITRDMDVYDPAISNSGQWYIYNPKYCNVYQLPMNVSSSSYEFWCIEYNETIFKQTTFAWYEPFGGFIAYAPQNIGLETLKVYTFNPSYTESNAQAGLRIYDASGRLTYDSGYRYLIYRGKKSMYQDIPDTTKYVTFSIVKARQGIYRYHFIRESGQGTRIQCTAINNLGAALYRIPAGRPYLYLVDIT